MVMLNEQLEKRTLYSNTGIVEEFNHDSMGRITKKDYQKSGISLVGFTYTYDFYGNRLSDTHLHKSTDSETFGFDTDQRLTNYNRTNGDAQNWQLDSLGNWNSFTKNGTTQTRVHNDVNEVTQVGSTNLTYDNNGNMTDNGTKLYTWDVLNRLTQIKDKTTNNLISKYYYDANNRRMVKSVDTNNDGTLDKTTNFYYDNISVSEERNASTGAITKTYVNAKSYVDEYAMVSNDATSLGHFYLSDLRYSVYALVDTSGVVVDRFKYDPYGKRTVMDASFNVVASPTVQQSYGYTGRRLDDESGLCHFRARYFDSELGRFISRDPIGYRGGGMNLYRGYFVPGGGDPSGYKKIRFKKSKKLNRDNLGARGHVSHSFAAVFECECQSNKKYKLKIIDGLLKITMRVLKSGHNRFQYHEPRYDNKWGANRSDSRERDATIAHETDHYSTYIDAWSEIKTANNYDGKIYADKSKCDNAKKCIEKEVYSLYALAVSHSKMFDQVFLWYGGAYSSFKYPFTGNFTCAD